MKSFIQSKCYVRSSNLNIEETVILFPSGSVSLVSVIFVFSRVLFSPFIQLIPVIKVYKSVLKTTLVNAIKGIKYSKYICLLFLSMQDEIKGKDYCLIGKKGIRLLKFINLISTSGRPPVEKHSMLISVSSVVFIIAPFKMIGKSGVTNTWNYIWSKYYIFNY